MIDFFDNDLLLVIFAGIIAFICFLYIYGKIRDYKLLKTVTKPNRGTKTERQLVLTLLKNGIPAVTIFHDLYLQKKDGTFAQIDVAVPTKVGIIVFEVKDYSGWIFGNGNNTQWTQVLAYGREKNRFYNPIKQNNSKIQELKRLFGNVPFYSVIVFYGDCIFKDISCVPEGVFLVKPNGVLGVVSAIMNNNAPAKYSDKREIVRIFKEAVANGDSIEVQSQHINDINDMLEKKQKTYARKFPSQ